MLKIIVGRAGAGKSQKCIEEFNSYIQNNIGISKPAFLFVPEQYNMITERRLLEYQIKENFKVKGLIGHEVLNFKRFVHRILSIYGSFDTKNLTETGKFMLITAAIENVKNELSFYKDLHNKSGDIFELLGLIDEFKKYNISCEKLNDIVTEDTYLNKKLSEISLVYNEYERLKKNNYSDSNDAFQTMLDIVKKENFFSRKSVWIDSFTGFTQKDLDLISIMITQCKSVTITLCTDLSTEAAFYAVDKTYNQLINLANNFGIDVSVENLSNKCEFELSKYNNLSLFQLEQNISKNYSTSKYEHSDIYLTECDNVYDEVIRCAKRIKDIHENGIEYNNIAVALRNIQGYDVVIKSIFNLYEIPFFIDDKKSIDNNPFIKTITSILSIVRKKWKPEDTLECIKANILDFIQDVDTMEEIILSTGLKGKRSWKNTENEKCKLFYESIESFENKLGKCTNLKEASICLCDFLKKHKAAENIKKIANDFVHIRPEIKNEYFRIWNIFIEVIEQVVLFLGDIKCNGAIDAAEQLSKLLVAGFGQYKIGFLPSNLNSVQIIDIDRSRSSNIKALFVLGLNDGVLPAKFNDDGILKDSDREKLEKNNVFLADSIETKMAKENFFIYFILSLPTDILDISWPLSDVSWNSVKYSTVVIRKIQKLFPGIIINHYENEETKNRALANDDAVCTIEKDINLDLFHIDGELTTTVSRIEKYNKCPFSYLLDYGLKLKEREEAELQTVDIGNFLHEMVDSASDILFEMNDVQFDDYRILAEKTFETIAENARLNIDNLTERDKHAINRIKDYTVWIFNNIKKQMDAGGMKLFGTEIEFNSKSSILKPLEIIPEDEALDKINVVGKIDRVDIMEKNNMKYVRIVDYKSSDTTGSISETNVKNGMKLQLVTYLYAVIESLGKSNTKPAGVFYYVFDDDITTNSVHFERNNNKETPSKISILKGFAIDDEEILQEMTRGDQGVIGGRKVSGGKLSFALNKNMLKTDYDFENMKNYVFDSIKAASVNITKGIYPVKPYISKREKINACEYCKMNSICAICRNLQE